MPPLLSGGRLDLPFPLILVVVALAGALNVFAFAPFFWWPLQILLLAGLFILVRQSPSIRHSAYIGLAFGTGWLTGGVWWLFISMHQYGGMPAPLAALAVFLLALGLGLLPAAATGGGTWLARRFSLSPTLLLLMVLPALWALSEWVRGWIFTGFPWVVSGYAHTASPLAGFAPLLGVYGIGWLAALMAATLALLPSKRLPALLIPLLLTTGWGLQGISWTEKKGEPISVRLLQGNVPQEMKFKREQIVATLVDYDLAIREQPADLIVTPETAIPMLSRYLPEEYVERLAAFSRDTASHVLLGLPISDGPQQYANSVLGIAPTTPSSATMARGAGFYRYDKHHLVPFGEFIPLGFRWFVDLMNMPLGDFTRGRVLQQPFAVGSQWVMPNICFEDLFGGEIATQLAAGRAGVMPEATILLNVSNIAWFGDSIALPQHLQISQMRSLETGRPMLRATNTGATAVIDHRGQVTAQLPPFEKNTLTATVQGYAGATPFILFGDRAFVMLALFALLIACLLGRKNANNSPGGSENR